MNEGLMSSASSDMVIDKLMIFRFSPEFWEAMHNNHDAPVHINILAGSLKHLANNMGLGDVTDLESRSVNNPNNPQIAEMIDNWKQKISLTINANFIPNASSEKGTIDNLPYLGSIFGNSLFKPRELRMTVTFDPKATKTTVTVSKDATHYDVISPASYQVDQALMDHTFLQPFVK